MTPTRRELSACVWTIVALLMLSFVTVTAPSAANAKGPDDLLGKWSGSIVVDGRPIAINLAVQSMKLGEDGAQFHYGVPRSCNLVAEYSGEIENAQFFSFKSANGGFCDRLIDGLMTLRLNDQETLSFDVRSQKKTVEEKGTLKKGD